MPEAPQRAGRTVFVTGTDTGIGKTRAACALLHALRARGATVAGFKPVATGCRPGPRGLHNADVRALQRAAGTALPGRAVNPYAFAPPIAPHIAAAAARRPIRPAVLDRAHARLAARHDWVVAEGAGGWMVPLDAATSLADWVAGHAFPVVMVVGMRLGCLNHALLTAEAIRRRGVLAGWIANVLPPPQRELAANLATLDARLGAPRLGLIGAGESAARAARGLDLRPLMA